MLHRYRYKGMARDFSYVPHPHLPRKSTGLFTLFVVFAGLTVLFLNTPNRPEAVEHKPILLQVVMSKPKPRPRVVRKEDRPVMAPTQAAKRGKKQRIAVHHGVKSGKRHKHRAKQRAIRPHPGISPNSVTRAGSAVAIPVGNPMAKPLQTKAVTGPQPSNQDSTWSDRVFSADEVRQAPSFLRQVMPRYPDTAQDDDVEGVVTIWLVIDEKGRPIRVKQAQGPRTDLVAAAKQAAMASRFTPAIYKGRPVKCVVKIPYRFELE